MPPRFLICGLEHTGTTLISDLFRQVPGLDSGFEVGAYLRNSPREFPALQPFAKHMLKGWGISQAAFEQCCDTDDFATFYGRLLASATVLARDTRDIFDKTPRYLSELTSVLGRNDLKAVVSYKDPRAIVFSDFKRARTEDFHGWYDGYHGPKLGYVKTCYAEFRKHADSPRITTIGLEDLAMNSRDTMERMFSHVGETFKLGYAVIDTLRYGNVKNNTVSADIAFEYKRAMPADGQKRVLEDFAPFDAWFYD